ncbi:peptide-methionine (S)-S-oxide reductase MsrA [uncultured Paraglaciecola sp.]|uniref:peptide-methionine (S)-S-oxide reductase MsrA n=1 Tax=uncultured Paraglaciecola sp. TaxID=1765024 RepID=UPI0026019A24|nr:peptide-methionine (S)-S-oxide reductase MsrA [uncultured Paraglaciecola sp.]
MKYKLLTVFLWGSILATSQAFADKAIFAGGCFWCMESDFEKLDGVTEVVSGFTGGVLENPTYSGNHQGHYEAIEVTYDPSKISYQALLNHYWINVDPFDDKGQFCDKGASYLSAVFVADQQQQTLAEISKQKVIDQFPNQQVVTPILPVGTFYPIKGKESYHQDYYKKSPVRYKFYRWNCGRDQRLQEIWGDKASH